MECARLLAAQTHPSEKEIPIRSVSLATALAGSADDPLRAVAETMVRWARALLKADTAVYTGS
jgi:hypothetical protein